LPGDRGVWLKRHIHNQQTALKAQRLWRAVENHAAQFKSSMATEPSGMRDPIRACGSSSSSIDIWPSGIVAY
jgi:hypothetical protein